MKQEVRRGGTLAMTIAIFMIVSISSIVYSFVQKKEADRQRMQLEQLQHELAEAKKEALRNKQEAEQQRTIAEAQRSLALRNEMMALEALNECKQNGKRK